MDFTEEQINLFEEELNRLCDKYNVGPFEKDIDDFEEEIEITYNISRKDQNRHKANEIWGNINKEIEKYSQENGILDYYTAVFVMMK